jgi:hypothetical protein
VFLSDQIVKRLRPVFARENLVAHAQNLTRAGSLRKQKSGLRYSRNAALNKVDAASSRVLY